MIPLPGFICSSIHVPRHLKGTGQLSPPHLGVNNWSGRKTCLHSRTCSSSGQEGDVISYQRGGWVILCEHPELAQRHCLSQPPHLLSHIFLICMWGWGEEGIKASGDICQLSSLIKELMRFSLWLLLREPIPALTERGLCVFFCLWNRDKFNFSIKLQLMCFQASVGLFSSSKLSSCQLMPKKECFQTRRRTIQELPAGHLQWQEFYQRV